MTNPFEDPKLPQTNPFKPDWSGNLNRSKSPIPISLPKNMWNIFFYKRGDYLENMYYRVTYRHNIKKIVDNFSEYYNYNKTSKQTPTNYSPKDFTEDMDIIGDIILKQDPRVDDVALSDIRMGIIEKAMDPDYMWSKKRNPYVYSNTKKYPLLPPQRSLFNVIRKMM